MWKGKWRNQYGSMLEITSEENQRIEGTFTTALDDSGFYGQSIPVVGFHQGDCIGITGGGKTTAGDAVVTYTGLLRDGKLETLWFVAADTALVASAPGQPAQEKKLNWWRSMSTSADTFERIH